MLIYKLVITYKNYFNFDKTSGIFILTQNQDYSVDSKSQNSWFNQNRHIKAVLNISLNQLQTTRQLSNSLNRNKAPPLFFSSMTLFYITFLTLFFPLSPVIAAFQFTSSHHTVESCNSKLPPCRSPCEELSRPWLPNRLFWQTWIRKELASWEIEEER